MLRFRSRVASVLFEPPSETVIERVVQIRLIEDRDAQARPFSLTVADLLEAQSIAMPESHLVGRVHARISQPSAEKHKFRGDLKGINVPGQRQLAQTLREGRRDDLVSIEVQNPFVPQLAMLQSKISLPGKIIKGSRYDPRAVCSRYFHGIVSASGIYDDDIIAPSKRIEAARKIRCFVVGQ
jgi:hypothetical protein